MKNKLLQAVTIIVLLASATTAVMVAVQGQSGSGGIEIVLKPPLPFESAYPAPGGWGYPPPPWDGYPAPAVTLEASSITAVPPTPTPWPTAEWTPTYPPQPTPNPEI